MSRLIDNNDIHTNQEQMQQQVNNFRQQYQQFIPIPMYIQMPGYGAQPFQAMPGQQMVNMNPYYPQMNPNQTPVAQFNYSQSYFNKQPEPKYPSPVKKKPSYIESLKYKSSDQIVNEFKAYTLPKLRLRRLIKLQSVMRGYYTRKFKIPRIKLQQKLMEDYTDRKINQFIESSIIPDLVLEVLAYNKYNEDFTLYSSEYRIYLEITSRILDKITREWSNNIVHEATSGIVTDMLKKRAQNKPPHEQDPFYLACDELISQFIYDDCMQIAKQSIDELVDEYILEQHFGNIWKLRFIPRLIAEVSSDAIDEIIVEDYVTSLANRMIDEFCNPLAVHMLEEFQVEQESEQLNLAVKNYVERGIIEVALEQILFMMKSANLTDNQLNNEFMKNAQLSQQMSQNLQESMRKSNLGSNKSLRQSQRSMKSKSSTKSAGYQNLGYEVIMENSTPVKPKSILENIQVVVKSVYQKGEYLSELYKVNFKNQKIQQALPNDAELIPKISSVLPPPQMDLTGQLFFQGIEMKIFERTSSEQQKFYTADDKARKEKTNYSKHKKRNFLTVEYNFEIFIRIRNQVIRMQFGKREFANAKGEISWITTQEDVQML